MQPQNQEKINAALAGTGTQAGFQDDRFHPRGEDVLIVGSPEARQAAVGALAHTGLLKELDDDPLIPAMNQVDLELELGPEYKGVNVTVVKAHEPVPSDDSFDPLDPRNQAW